MKEEKVESEEEGRKGYGNIKRQGEMLYLRNETMKLHPSGMDSIKKHYKFIHKE